MFARRGESVQLDFTRDELGEFIQILPLCLLAITTFMPLRFAEKTSISSSHFPGIPRTLMSNTISCLQRLRSYDFLRAPHSYGAY